MRLGKKLITFAVAGLALVGTAACSNGKNNSSSNDAKIPSKITKKTTVVFWHGMHGAQENTLKQLTNDFEKKNPYLSNLLWQFFVTFAAIHVVFIALDWFAIIEVNGQRVKIFIGATMIAVLFRLMDPTSYPNSMKVRK